jgi:flagellar hook protein FlgE
MSSFASSLSGLNAASWLVAVAAGNVANVNSAGYRAKRVDFEANAEGSVRAQAPADSGAELAPEGSNVDLTNEMVNLLVGNTYFRANLAALKAQDQLLGLALDIKA